MEVGFKSLHKESSKLISAIGKKRGLTKKEFEEIKCSLNEMIIYFNHCSTFIKDSYYLTRNGGGSS